MPSGISGTHQATEHAQRTRLQQAGIVRQVDHAAAMTSIVLDGAFTALRRRYPHADA